MNGQFEMRARLEELIGAERGHVLPGWLHSYGVRLLAEHLLAAGVLVPPCKEGDMLYQPFPLDCKILEYKVLSWSVREWGFHITTHSMQTGGLCPIRGDNIGKKYFLTREEAEKALAEREGKG